MRISNSSSSRLSLYIFLYNVMMFAIHLKVFLKLLDAQMSGKFDFSEHFSLFLIGTSAQLLDVLHGILGVTNTGIGAALIQVFGRMLMLYVIEGNPDLHTHLTTHMLLFAWVLIELFRYPFYALRSWNVEIYALTWLRYSAWIPLYPAGFFFEWLSMVSSLSFYYESGKYSIQLPYTQLSLNFAVVLGVLSFIVMPLVSRKLLVHMSEQRRKKFHARKHQ